MITEKTDRPYPVPDDEEGRLDALYGFNILDTLPEPAYDRIIALAAGIFSVPMASISLIDRDRQWFKAQCGLTSSQTSRDVSLCAHAIVEMEALVICDTREDPRFAHNPLVTGPPWLRFYAGAPLRTDDGYVIGTLCVMDRVPRCRPDPASLKSLTDLAALVVEQLEFRSAVEGRLRAEQERDALLRKANAELRDITVHRAAQLDLTNAALDAEKDLRRETEATLFVSRVELKEALRQYTFLADCTPHILWTSDAQGHVDYYNQRWFAYTGLDFETAKGSGWYSALHPDDLPGCIALWEKSLASGQDYEAEMRLRRDDGEYRWHLARALPFRNQSGEIIKWFGTSINVHTQKTETRRLEESVEQRTVELRRSLREKETLLKEVHHRVKNNLQIVSSLLRMQESSLQDSKAKSALNESQRRVLSMALIHERLYGGQQMDRIDFADYTALLVKQLVGIYNGEERRVSCNLQLRPVLLNVDQAIPCGLILNELVTNALKYAYPAPQRGEVLVRLTEPGAGQVQLSVIDQGVGLPAGLDWKNSTSLGLPIVDILTEQLGGTLQVKSTKGSEFTIIFPNRANEEAPASDVRI